MLVLNILTGIVILFVFVTSGMTVYYKQYDSNVPFIVCAYLLVSAVSLCFLTLVRMAL